MKKLKKSALIRGKNKIISLELDKKSIFTEIKTKQKRSSDYSENQNDIFIT